MTISLFLIPKEALNIPVENIKESETSVPPPSPTHDQSDNHDAEGNEEMLRLFEFLP